jgi:predicted permease
MRLLTQLLTEGLVLVVCGTSAGLLLAAWMTSVLPDLIPTPLATSLFAANLVSLDGRSFLVCMSAGVVTVCLCGLLPAIRSSRTDLVCGLHGSGHVAGAARSGRRLRVALQSAQVALTTVLLVGASLVGTSFVRMLRAESGYDVDGLLAARLSLPEARYPDRESRAGVIRDVVTRMQKVPGVRVAEGAPPTIPFYGRFAAADSRNAVDRVVSTLFFVAPEYFAVVGMRLKSGRFFTEHDLSSDPPVAVMDEKAATLYWPGESPLGRQFRYSPYTPWTTVVGVVTSVKTPDFNGPYEVGEAFLPVSQASWSGSRWLVVRGLGDPMALGGRLSAIAREIDPAIRVESAERVLDMYAPALIAPRFQVVLISLLAALALVTASVGLFGLLACAVNERLREIGIRLALGARPVQLRRIVMAQALVPVGVGIALGLAVSAAVSHTASSLLYDTAPRDPLSIGLAVAVLLAATALAAFVPIRRATAVDPLVVLKAE